MATETRGSTRHLRRCAIDGCAWRGICPDHDLEGEIDAQLDRLMRLRPFGAGRKHRRSAAKYAQSHQIKSEVTVTTVEERRKNSPVPIRRKRHIVHPDTLAAVRALTSSLRPHRTGANASSHCGMDPHAAPLDDACPAVEEVREAPRGTAAVPAAARAKPSPALLANLRRPDSDHPVPTSPGPPSERTSPLLRLAGSSSSAALSPAIEAMRKARARSQAKQS